MAPTIVLIHIGKCGGTSINNFLRRYQLPFVNVHVQRALYRPDVKYLILLRNPVQRFQSAFYWRQQIVCHNKLQRDRFPGEYECLKRHATVADYVHSLADKHHETVHHLKENISFHLQHLLPNVKPEQILGVICVETLAEDVARIFPHLPWTHEHGRANLASAPKLETGTDEYAKLKAHLAADYQCIERLHELGALTAKQYELLTK